MTLVLVVKGTDKIVMAADLMAVNGNDEVFKVPSKIHPFETNKGKGLIGSSGGYVAHNACDIFEPPDHPDGMSNYIYMLKFFNKALSKGIEQSVVWDDTESDQRTNTWLVAYQSELFIIAGPSMQVIKSVNEFETIGSGSPMAVGAISVALSLRANNQISFDTVELVDLVMHQVGQRHLYVGADYCIKTLVRN